MTASLDIPPSQEVRDHQQNALIGYCQGYVYLPIGSPAWMEAVRGLQSLAIDMKDATVSQTVHTVALAARLGAPIPPSALVRLGMGVGV